MGAKLGALLLACALGAGALTVTGCAGKTAPVTSPDPVAVKILNAAREAGIGVAAAQAAEQVYYRSGQSRITAADQAKIDAAFSKVSSSVLDAIAAYQAALSATSKQALVDAVKNGVTDIVRALQLVSDQKLADYIGWINTAEGVFLAVAS